jgi:hypothetical protein
MALPCTFVRARAPLWAFTSRPPGAANLDLLWTLAGI